MGGVYRCGKPGRQATCAHLLKPDNSRRSPACEWPSLTQAKSAQSAEIPTDQKRIVGCIPDGGGFDQGAIIFILNAVKYDEYRTLSGQKGISLMADVFRYEVIPSASWAYLSTILMVSIYFKFNRFISVRNLDILMLAMLAPGLLIVQHYESERQKLQPVIEELLLEEEQLKTKLAGEQAKDKDGANDATNVAKTSESKEDEEKKGSDDSPAEVIVDPELATLSKEISEKNLELAGIKGSQRSGYIWLFVAGAALLIRMLIDPFLIRRPLLEPNLEFSGLTFLTVVLLFFLIANIIAASVAKEDITAAESGKNLATAKATDPTRSKGPGYSLLFLFPVIPTFVADDDGSITSDEDVAESDQSDASTAGANPDDDKSGDDNPVDIKSNDVNTNDVKPGDVKPGDVNPDSSETQPADPATVPSTGPEHSLTIVAKIMAIIGQLAIVIGIYLIGYLHFGNTRMGIGIVTLYLLLPYTAEMTGRIIHILPAAAMVWAIVCYRKPFWAGTFIGLAMGLAYYPIYLLPLWFSFYWHRGLKQFLIGFLVMVVILAVTLIFTSSDLQHFWQNMRAMFGIWTPLMDGLTGFWEDGSVYDESYRLPIMAAFFCLSISFAAWPAQKDLGTLLSCSAALMITVQFWNGFGGGLLMAWYLPLTLMAMFRPNLEDRTAIALSLNK